jgi:hypothetical protein
MFEYLHSGIFGLIDPILLGSVWEEQPKLLTQAPCRFDHLVRPPFCIHEQEILRRTDHPPRIKRYPNNPTAFRIYCFCSYAAGFELICPGLTVDNVIAALIASTDK